MGLWLHLTCKSRRQSINTIYSGPDVPLRYRYQTFELGDEDIHLRTLRDAQQYSDPDGKAHRLGISAANWGLFGVVWDSSQILARLMVDFEIEGKRILELGCGMALSSLLLNRRGGDVTATDYHPEAGVFLKKNTELNEDSDIPFFLADWKSSENCHEPFDLIIGSDVLYESYQLAPLARFIESHSKPICEVILVDPGRKQQGVFQREMSQLGFDHRKEAPADIRFLHKLFTGSILRFNREWPSEARAAAAAAD